MREIRWLREAEDELANIVTRVLLNQGESVALEVYKDTSIEIILLWSNRMDDRKIRKILSERN